MNETGPLHVVAAILVRNNKVLACRRASHKASPGLWEFPGGKVKPGEKPHDALAREIKEELDVTCHIIESFDTSDTAVGSIVIRLETALCRMDHEGSIVSSDHDSLVWVGAAEAINLEWAEPDLPSLSKLIQLGIIK